MAVLRRKNPRHRELWYMLDSPDISRFQLQKDTWQYMSGNMQTFVHCFFMYSGAYLLTLGPLVNFTYPATIIITRMTLRQWSNPERYGWYTPWIHNFWKYDHKNKKGPTQRGIFWWVYPIQMLQLFAILKENLYTFILLIQKLCTFQAWRYDISDILFICPFYQFLDRVSFRHDGW